MNSDQQIKTNNEEQNPSADLLAGELALQDVTDTLNKSTNNTVNSIQVKRPSSIAETGLSEQLLLHLLIKHVLVEHVMTVRHLAKKMALSGGIIQSLLESAKILGWLENRQSDDSGQMRYALSGLGKAEAEKALAYSGYLGLAPVPLQQYAETCKRQTSRNTQVVKAKLLQQLSKLMLDNELISALGPALNSTKPVLIYGPPGAGKSYLCRHLNLVYGDAVYIPSAIEVNNVIIQVFDPQVHTLIPIELEENSDHTDLLSLNAGHDPRWHLCQRPLIITGGELAEHMLEVNVDKNNRTYRAPIQLKANNGILLLDDLGRQKITPVELFNRWIIPLEERIDFLSLPNGLHFEVPFEQILLFSTNLEPRDLVDEAFLRRLGYKIEFKSLDKSRYEKLWQQVCTEYGLTCDDTVFSYLCEQLHSTHSKPFLPCYPRDLLSIASDQVKFNQLAPTVTKDLLDFSWQHYFVR